MTDKKTFQETELNEAGISDNTIIRVSKESVPGNGLWSTFMFRYSTLLAKIGATVTGTVWRSGSGAPSNGLGVNGDFYLDAVTGNIYKKAAGVYTLAGNLKGATGAAGANGTNGIDGTNGTNGTNGADGADGTNGTNGTNGTDGAPGVGVPTGGTTGQKLVKISNTNYDTQWVDDSSRNIVTARVLLTALQLATLNSVPIDIPSYPAPGAGFAWQVIACSVKYSFVTIDYNFSQFWIITNAHIQPQGFITNSQIGVDYISQGTIGGYQSTMEENQKLQISADFDDSALGDSTAVVYVTAMKVAL